MRPSAPERPRSRLLLLVAFAAAAGALLAPAGRADVDLPGTQPGDLVEWPILVENTSCRVCHGDPFNGGDVRVEPWETWAGSMMANAARDPLFWAAVDIANQDAPSVGIGGFCIRCHSPRAWLQGRSSAPDGTAMEGTKDVPGGDFEGIDCQVCHRIEEGSPTYLQNGQYWVSDPPNTGGWTPPLKGPYDDSKAGHPIEFSTFHQSSEFCAVCHDLRNPLVNLKDETGADTGRLFPEQISYSEWSQSDFATEGTSCQDCHMPAGEGFVCNFLLQYRTDVPVHTFQGANAWMTEVLQGLYGESLGRQNQYTYARLVALDMLQNRSAELRVLTPPSLPGGSDATVDVRVTNLTGHKLPTGYPEGRRMWLNVRMIDAEGSTLWESGAYDAATADLLPDPDLKVYETVHGQHAEGPGFHLVLNDRIFQDNRIPPRGFVPDADTQPVGYEYPELPDGTLPHWDDTQYVVNVPAGTPSPVTVVATLLYQTASKEYVEFLRDENVTGPDPHDPDPGAPSRGQKMWDLWDEYDRCPPIPVATAQRRIWLDRTPPEVAPAPEPVLPRIAGLSENPFRSSTTVAYDVPADGPVTLSAYDVAGRRVATLVARGETRGTHSVAWNGRTDAGVPVASGTYFLRLDVAGHAPVVARVVRLR